MASPTHQLLQDNSSAYGVLGVWQDSGQMHMYTLPETSLLPNHCISMHHAHN
jgi:hypothetical protein